MIIIQFGQDLLHYRLAEQDSLGADTEPVTVLPDCSHLTVIQIDDLPVAAHQRLLLLFEIFRINA